MNFAYEGTEVKGLNRVGTAPELTGKCTPQDLVWGMETEFYSASAEGTLVPKTQDEIDVILASRILKSNSQKAKAARDKQIEELQEHDTAVKYGLPSIMTEKDVEEKKSAIQLLQGEKDNPKPDVDYEPVVPVKVVPPSYRSFTVTVVRVEGWQGKLGYKVVLRSMEKTFEPTNMALAQYANPDCADYLLTTGAFTETDGVWGAVCPAGHEPGDIDINFGILYGSLPVKCWTMKQGIEEQAVTVFEETNVSIEAIK